MKFCHTYQIMIGSYPKKVKIQQLCCNPIFIKLKMNRMKVKG